MLHSTLPRAFLPPGLSYLGGYYGEDGHVYTSAAHYVACHEDPYGMRIASDPRLSSWENARPVSPTPLDLSLKAAPTSSSGSDGPIPIEERMEDGEAIEVGEDDEEEPRFAGRSPGATSSTANRPYSSSLPVEDRRGEVRATSSVHGYHSYLATMPIKESREASGQAPGAPRRDDIPLTSNIEDYEPPTNKRETEDSAYVVRGEASQDDHRDYPGLRKPDSPVNSANYQQLLLTPQHHLQSIHAPMTPPSTPSPPQCPRRRHRDEPEVTPSSAHGNTPRHHNVTEKSNRTKKKHARRLKFDEDTSSPVSGTVILGPDEAVVTGDIDPAFNIVEVTEEARAELAKIENRLGPYQCKLCRQLHEDAFQLAQHRCSRIAHVEYRCPECDKRFSCPANLASHRRWHKPRIPNPENLNGAPSNPARETEIACTRCDVKFTRAAALRKHLATQHPETNNNVDMANHNNNSNDNVSAFEDLNVSAPGKPPLCLPVSMNLSNVTLPNEFP